MRATIANKVRRARIDDVLGDFGDNRNVHEEQQQKLDVIANEIIKACLGARANIGALVSYLGVAQLATNGAEALGVPKREGFFARCAAKGGAWSGVWHGALTESVAHTVWFGTSQQQLTPCSRAATRFAVSLCLLPAFASARSASSSPWQSSSDLHISS